MSMCDVCRLPCISDRRECMWSLCTVSSVPCSLWLYLSVLLFAGDFCAFCFWLLGCVEA